MIEGVMRRVEELHRIFVRCPCSAQFSMPIDGYSYHPCRCWRIYEHGWRSDQDHERFLKVHDRPAWERLQVEAANRRRGIWAFFSDEGLSFDDLDYIEDGEDGD